MWSTRIHIGDWSFYVKPKERKVGNVDHRNTSHKYVSESVDVDVKNVK